MSAVAATRDTPLPDRSTATRFSGLVRAEVAKLTSTRAAGWLVLAAAALSALAVSGVVNAGVARSALATETGVRTVLGHGGLAAILPLVLGVLVSAGEYRHGTVVDTFLSEPRHSHDNPGHASASSKYRGDARAFVQSAGARSNVLPSFGPGYGCRGQLQRVRRGHPRPHEPTQQTREPAIGQAPRNPGEGAV